MTTTKKQQNLIKQSERWWAREEAKIDKIIGNFSASFMSNAKWRKVLSLLADSTSLISCYRWKFVDTEKLFETPVIETAELQEKRLKDGKNQPFIYREVEWLEVVTNESKAITKELLKRGQFAIDKSEIGFKIIGYSKNSFINDPF